MTKIKEKIKNYLDKNRSKNKLYTLLYAVFVPRLHWYDCQFYYKQKGADMYIVDFNCQVGFMNQNDILKPRKVKKLVGSRVENLPKRVLKNGDFYFKINSYLGRFSK